MRALSIALVLAACGGSSTPPAQPTPEPQPEAPTATVTSEPPAAPEPEPAPAPPPPPKKSLVERLRDDTGDVAGLPGWKIERTADANHCSGFKIVTTKGKKKLSADEQPLANVYAVAFPTGLNFDPDPKFKKQREASKKKFDDFTTTMQKVGGDATKHYEAWFAQKQVDTSIQAAARLAQISMRFASLLARAEIPKDVRTGEFAADKTAAFCDKMHEVAEPIVVRAEEAAQICATKAAEAKAPEGWWTHVCAP